MKKISIVAGSFVALILVGVFFTFKADALVVRWGESYNLESYSTTDDDLYTLNDQVVINGTTNGDVFAGGSNIVQTGTVTEDMLLVGGVVNVAGETKGDVRIAGGKVFVDGHIHEDAILLGGTVNISKDAVIDGDLLVYAEHLVIEGVVSGVANIHARTVEIKGTMNNRADIEAYESLSLTGNAYIEGDLAYSAPREALISDTAIVKGEKIFTPGERQKDTGESSQSMGIVILTLMTVFSALSLLYFFPVHTRSMVRVGLSDSAGIHILKAIVLIFFIPVLAFIVVLTLVGIVPGFLIFFLYGVLILAGMSLAPVLAGVLLTRILKKNDKELTLAWTALGAIAFSLIVYVPVLGWLTRTLLFLIAFYAVVDMLYEGVWKKRKDVATDAIAASSVASIPENEKHNKESGKENSTEEQKGEN